MIAIISLTGLNYFKGFPIRNNPIYTTTSANISNFAPSLYTFIYIYIKNPFNLDFVPLNRLIKSILTFIVPILFNFLF